MFHLASWPTASLCLALDLTVQGQVGRSFKRSKVSGVSGVSGDDSSRVVVPGVSVRRRAAVPASRWEGGGGGSEGGGGGGPAGEGWCWMAHLPQSITSYLGIIYKVERKI